MNLKTIIPTLTSLLLIPLISARPWGLGGFSGSPWGWSGYYGSPLDYLDNEWVMFGILFIIFFGVIYYTLNKSFKNNAVAVVVGGALALFLSMAIARRGLLISYGGDPLSSWALLIAVIIGLGFLIKFASESFGIVGAVIGIIGAWLIINTINPFDYIPYISYGNDFLIRAYEFFASGWGLTIFIIIALIFGSRKKRTPGENIIQGFGKLFGKN